MRLICPSCDAQYEVADNVIPASGRDVQCSNCGTTWFQEPVRAKAQPAPARPAPPPPTAEVRSPHHDTPNWQTEPRDLQPPPPPRVSEDAASILREEAMRELRARLSERPKVETQPDFGLVPPKEERVAAEPSPTEPAPAAAARVSSRHHLPDVGEIDTSLAAHGEPVPQGADAIATASAAYRKSFRSGFGLSLAAGVAAAVLYAFAPQIGVSLPAVDPALKAYVAGADSLRLMLADAVGALAPKPGA